MRQIIKLIVVLGVIAGSITVATVLFQKKKDAADQQVAEADPTESAVADVELPGEEPAKPAATKTTPVDSKQKPNPGSWSTPPPVAKDSEPPKVSKDFRPSFKPTPWRDPSPSTALPTKPKDDFQPVVGRPGPTDLTRREPSPSGKYHLPSRPATPTTSAKPRYHKIIDGDTLASLAQQYWGNENDYLSIYDANRNLLPSAELLPIGVRLKIPARPIPVETRRPVIDDEMEMVPVPQKNIPKRTG